MAALGLLSLAAGGLAGDHQLTEELTKDKSTLIADAVKKSTGRSAHFHCMLRARPRSLVRCTAVAIFLNMEALLRNHAGAVGASTPASVMCGSLGEREPLWASQV
ncbi:unnamed protein product [Symbiodinium sp. CCMP2592]|nr:unnamed protein product [Symbiodinium sp. CCMP2592]